MSLKRRNPLDPIPFELRKTEGIHKLRRQIDKELKSPNVNEKSSNLPHLLSILKCTKDLSQPCSAAVLKPFPFSKGRNGRLIVDIVSPSPEGHIVFYKVSARNPKALNLLAAGGGNFGQKSILDHVQEYLECAGENPCLFKTPKVTAIFTSGISAFLAQELESMGVVVQGERIPDSELEGHPRIRGYQEDYCFCDSKDTGGEEDRTETAEHVLGYKNPNMEGVTKLNLDISAFFAIISNLTNGHWDTNFPTLVLRGQAEAERMRPQKPILDSIFEGRQLYCCETAMRDFQSILSTVGGAEEKRRGEEFINRVTVVPDEVSERVQSLTVSGNRKERSLVIFGTGDSIRAVTVTANSGFVRSAKTQGIDLAAFVHESRALTEQKEMMVKVNTL